MSSEAAESVESFVDLRLEDGYTSVPQVIYKAALAGVLLVAVDPRNTSRECSHCVHTAKQNRKTQDEFTCVQCGFALHADINAAINIRSRPAVKWPIVASCAPA